MGSYLWAGYLFPGYRPGSLPDGAMLFCPAGGARLPSGPSTWSGLEEEGQVEQDRWNRTDLTTVHGESIQ